MAPKKIIHLKMSELYAIVRGKAGKSVEVGLKWGISCVGGGFVQGFLINGGLELKMWKEGKMAYKKRSG